METKTKTQRSTKQSTNAARVVAIERIFNLPADKVWQALTEPESIKQWWGPRDFTCPYSTVDLRKGGKYLNCMRSSKGEDFWTTGVFREIAPNRKVVYTDSFSDEQGNIVPASDYDMPGEWPKELLVSVTLEEAGSKTKLRLQHEGIPAEMHDDCVKGWNESFDKLQENIK